MIGCAVLVLLTACGGGSGSGFDQDNTAAASESDRESRSDRSTFAAAEGVLSDWQLSTAPGPVSAEVDPLTTDSSAATTTMVEEAITAVAAEQPDGVAAPRIGISQPLNAVIPSLVQQVNLPVATVVQTSTASAPSTESSTTAATSSQSTPQDRLSALLDPTLGLVATQRVAIEDWAGARTRVANSRTYLNWVRYQKSAVEAWSALGRERADLVGGYIHDYVDPNTGIPLKWEEGTPEPADGSTEKSLRFKQAWVAFARQRNINYTLIAARLYRLTGDAAMGDWARKQLDFYAQQYALWPLRTYNGRARMFRHGLDEAYNVFALVDAARLLRDSSNSTQVKLWHDQLFVPMAANLQTVTSPMTNVALWHATAMAAIAMQVGDTAMLEKALTGPLGIRTTLSMAITADHIWFEGSLGYNQYVIDALSKLLVHASLQGKAASFGREWGDARRLLLATLDFRFEDGTLPIPGDATASLMALDDRSYSLLYRVVPTWYGSRAVSTTTSWEALLDPPVVFSAEQPTLPPVQTRDFPAIRMAVLRAGTWQAFVHYGQVATHHWQEEALTYELHQGRNRISSDSGTVSYSSPYHLNYFRRSAAHNVPLVDGMGQQRWNAGVVREFSLATPRLVVDHPTYSDGVAVSRTYSVSNTGFTERTTINVGAGSPSRRLGSAFHTDCAPSPVSGLTKMTSLPAVPATEATSYWRMQNYFEARGAWVVRLDCGTQAYELRVNANSNNPQRIYLGKAPTRPLPAERAVVYYETEGAAEEFLTEIRQVQ